MTSSVESVATVLRQYEEAVNRWSVPDVVALYVPDGVFMPEYGECAAGAEAVGKAYRAIFATVAVQILFRVAESREFSPDWAFARTESTGKFEMRATGILRAETHHGLFLLQRVDGRWRIARYCYSLTHPPRA